MLARALLGLALVTGLGCSDDDDGGSSGALAPSDPAGDTVVVGRLSVGDTVPPEATEDDSALELARREVVVKDARGNTVAAAQTQSDGSYSVMVPNSLIIDTGDGAALTASGGATVETVIADTSDGTVVGVSSGLDLGQRSGRVLDVGSQPLEKITAIRGQVVVEGGTSHIGAVVYVPGTSYAARTDAAGQYIMTFLPAGTYTVRIEKDGYTAVEHAGVVVEDNETTKLEVRRLSLSGGARDISVLQLGTPGFTGERSVTFVLFPGSADRFKGGLKADIESAGYGAIPETFTYNFDEDGTFDLQLVFADADGFETVLERQVVVDTVAPDANTVSLVDRSSLSSTYSNEREVLAYHASCEDVAVVAILPADASAPTDSDFRYECFAASAADAVSFELPEGTTTYDYQLWARDAAGNRSATAKTGSLILDETAPGALTFTVTDQTSGSTAGTDITTVDISVPSCDGISSIIVNEAQLLPPDPAQFTRSCAAGEAFPYTLANNIAGAKNLLGWAMDPAGNVSTVAGTQAITLDQTAPTAPSFTLVDPTDPGQTGYTNTVPYKAVPANCTDTTHIMVSQSQSSKPGENASGWTACSTDGIDITTTGDGSKSFTLWARDVGGNVSAASTSATVVVDTTRPSAPGLTLTDPSSGSSTHSNQTTLDVAIGSCGDAYRVHLTESTATPAASAITTSCATSGSSYTLSNTGDGSKTVYLWVIDQAGNVSSSASSATFTLDTIAPALPSTLTLADATNGSTIATNSTTVDYTLSSCPSGTLIYLGDGASAAPAEGSVTTSCATSGQTTITASAGTRTVYLWIKDQAGNMAGSALTDGITYDASAPSAPSFDTLDADSGADAAYTNALAIKATVSSCSDITALTFNESSSTPSEATVNQSCSTAAQNYDITLSSGEGLKTVYLWVRDEAGNLSSASDTIRYDVTAPTLSSVQIDEVATTSYDLSFSSDEVIYTRLNWGTATATYTDSYTGGSSTTSHSHTISTQDSNALVKGTTYYTQAVALDHAEQQGTNVEISLRVPEVMAISGVTDNIYAGATTAGTTHMRRPLNSCDVNGDGKDDLIVASPSETFSSRATAGVVYVFFGRTTLPATASLSDANVTIGGASAGNYFGHNILCGQISGTATDDLIISVSNNTPAIYIIEGGAISGTLDMNDAGDYDVKMSSAEDGFSYTRGMAVGNVNGDSYDDLLICWSNGDSNCDLYFGSATFNTTSDAHIDDQGYDAGIGVAIADVDGDGYGDMLVPNPDIETFDQSKAEVGGFEVYRGSSGISGLQGTPNTTVYGFYAGEGLALLETGDLDDDGYDDVVMRGDNINGERAMVVWGRSTATWDAIANDRLELDSNDDLFTNIDMSSTTYQRHATWADIGDYDGDGKDDMVVGHTTRSPNSLTDAGKVCLYLNRSRANWLNITGFDTLGGPDFCVEGASTTDLLGTGVKMLNFDGTGSMELAITAPAGEGGGTNRGEVTIVEFDIPTNRKLPILLDLSPHY